MSYAETGLIHILVIDDDRDMRQLYAELLLPLGHQLVLAESGEEGLEQLPYQVFDIAFLDHQLPGMDGLIFGQYLIKNNPHMQIALVTGNAEPRLKRVTVEHNITFIPKPFDLDSLLHVIDEYKRLSQVRRDSQDCLNSSFFAPVIHESFQDLPQSFELPEVPSRIQKVLALQIREALSEMLRGKHFSEATRTKAFTGLITAQVLGLKLPKMKDGSTPWETYDAIMIACGGRTEFGE